MIIVKIICDRKDIGSIYVVNIIGKNINIIVVLNIVLKLFL